MAKLKPSTKPSKPAPAVVDDTEAVSVDQEVTAVDTAEDSAEDTEASVQEDSNANRTVRCSVFRELNPSPVIGKVNFSRDLNMPVLKVGVHTLPYEAAIVLVDKGIASIL